jgi:hypothetical protein
MGQLSKLNIKSMAQRENFICYLSFVIYLEFRLWNLALFCYLDPLPRSTILTVWKMTIRSITVDIFLI